MQLVSIPTATVSWQNAGVLIGNEISGEHTSGSAVVVAAYKSFCLRAQRVDGQGQGERSSFRHGVEREADIDERVHVPGHLHGELSAITTVLCRDRKYSTTDFCPHLCFPLVNAAALIRARSLLLLQRWKQPC